MQIKDITNYLESLAPLSSQESYDNAGLICGDKNTTVTNALISLDCTEEIIQEAIDRGCNIVISHHPIVFKGLKTLTGKNYVERTLIKAIKNDIAIYAIHTNLDNYEFGVNKKIGDLLNIKSPKILVPASQTLNKLSFYVPHSHKEIVLEALFKVGAGQIGNYSECSYSINGEGSFKANKKAIPFVGEIDKRHLEQEVKIEVLVSSHNITSVTSQLFSAHPYEEVPYDIYPLNNKNNYEGSGMIGELENEMNTVEFLQHLKDTFKCGVIKHTNVCKSTVKTIAWCGGSGSFLLKNAKQQKADIFITGDFKYHEFFDSENQIIIADIGHFESEQFTIDLIGELLSKNFTKFAPCLTGINTNPVKYF
jgi:dinuclear metal center YbgI/SA1388 family protein